eukprot:scaffold84189_cov35-Attheya_sp.AAC.1
MHKSLCENAAAVTSNLGGGNHGHLALLVTDTAYFEETQLAFIAPTNPGDDPPTALNPEEQSFVNDCYKRNQRIYERRPSRNRSKRRWKQPSSAHYAMNSPGSIKSLPFR